MKKQDIVPDLTNLPEEEKTKIIKELGDVSGKAFMSTFIALGLKDGMDYVFKNNTNGDTFSLSFKKN